MGAEPINHQNLICGYVFRKLSQGNLHLASKKKKTTEHVLNNALTVLLRFGKNSLYFGVSPMNFYKVSSNGKCGIICHCYFEYTVQREGSFLLRFVDNVSFLGKNFEYHNNCSAINIGRNFFEGHYFQKPKLFYILYNIISVLY